MKKKHPNVILMNCDDLGYGDLGCYGSLVNKTPAIDNLAKNGIRFTDFYMASPVCSPSRGGMMTGCYPPRIGFGEFDGEWVLFPGQGIGLNPNEMTIPKLFKNANYRTKIIGKWHCGDQSDFLPTNYGFDEYYGLPYSNDMGRQIGKENFPPLPLIDGSDIVEEQPDQSTLTERYVEQAIKFIQKKDNHPFFLYFAQMHVHLPLYTSNRFIKQSKNGDYGACVEAIDWTVQCIQHELKKQNIQNDTIFIFTSDNGSRGDNGGTNFPLRGTKGTTWEGGLRVPCIISWPGTIPDNNVNNDIIRAMDFLPTFSSILDEPLPNNRIIDGIDISDILFDNKHSISNNFFYFLKNNLEAVRSGKWKLHTSKCGNKLNELYNLEDDISETNNLYKHEPEVVAQLTKLLKECQLDIGDELNEITGSNIRPAGRVNKPKSLTEYDEDHPYIIALYDTSDCG